MECHDRYVRATPSDGETLAEVAARLEIKYFRGSGYYKLVKSEKISQAKALVLAFSNESEDGDNHSQQQWIEGGSEVRSRLGWGSGTITIQPTDLPDGNELFIQSVSANRKLPAGHDVLLRKPATLDSGNVLSAALNPRTSTRATPHPTSNASDTKRGVDNIVMWTQLIFPIEEEVECLDESSLVLGAGESGIPGDCDMSVPANLVQDAISKVHDAIRVVTSWQVLEEIIAKPSPKRYRYSSPETYCRYQWHSTSNGGYRLMYVHSPNATFMALEVQSKSYGLVSGNCGAHPFVHSPEFLYSNSDGSSSDIALNQDYLITPDVVLAKLVHDTVLHCGNGEH